MTSQVKIKEIENFEYFLKFNEILTRIIRAWDKFNESLGIYLQSQVQPILTRILIFILVWKVMDIFLFSRLKCQRLDFQRNNCHEKKVLRKSRCCQSKFI